MLDFKPHPNYPHLLVSTCGKVEDTSRQMCPLPLNEGDPLRYPDIHIPDVGSVKLYRLVAETHVYLPPTEDRLMVNHVDGDRQNSHANNLEWVTAGENVRHAVTFGLTPTTRRLKSMNLKTGEIRTYISSNQAAAEFGVNPAKVYRYLNSNVHKPWEVEYELVRVTDPWRGLTVDDIGMGFNVPKEVYVFEDDGTVRLFDHVRAAANYYKTAYRMYDTLGGFLAGRGHLLVYAINVCVVGGSYVKHDSKRRSKPKELIRKSDPIRVINMATEETEDYDSILDFAKVVGSTRNTIQRGMAYNDGRWNDYLITYRSELNEDVTETYA